jgi:hypothetical protein
MSRILLGQQLVERWSNVGQTLVNRDASQDLQSAMRGHLRLHYSAQEGSDEQVWGEEA